MNEGPATSTAVIYLRVSTSEQANRGGEAEGFSIPIQRERIQMKARELGASIVQEFVDAGKSATTMNRVGLKDLLTFATTEKPDYVIVYKLDRLARNLLDNLVIRRSLEQAGVQLVSCTEAFDDTAAGELALNIMGSVNQHYSRNLAEEMKNKLVGKVKSGGTVGKAPIGYLNTIERSQGVDVRSVAVDVVRGPLVQWAFEAYATGEWSLTALTEALAAKGLTTVPSRKMAEKPVPRSTVARMLRKPYYTGMIPWKGVLYPGNHPALVSQRTFNAVQAVLDAHNQSGEKQRVHNHYLKGSVRCGSCGSSLCITKAVNRHGTAYMYFFCLGNYRGYVECSQRAIPVDVVEAHIEAKWQAVQFDPEYAETIRELLTRDISKGRERQERERARATKRHAQLNEERLKLLNAHYADAIPLELLKSEQERISREIADTEGSLAATEMKIEEIESLLRRCLEFLTNCYQTYVGSSQQGRRQLNQAMFEAFFVSSDGALEAKPTEFFEALLRADALRVKNGRAPRKTKAAASPTHDSREWDDGIPKWIVELGPTKRQGSNRRRCPRSVLSQLGLNEHYLAEGGGIRTPGGLHLTRFRGVRISPLCHPSAGECNGARRGSRNGTPPARAAPGRPAVRDQPERRSAKNEVSRDEASSARTPAVTSTSWLRRGSAHRL